MNSVVVGGVVDKVVNQVKDGSKYGKIKITVKGKDNRTDLIEVVAKSDDLQGIHSGDNIVVQGLLSGRENDRGYINLGVFAVGFDVFPNTETQYNRKESNRRPSGSREEQEEDIPF